MFKSNLDIKALAAVTALSLVMAAASAGAFAAGGPRAAGAQRAAAPRAAAQRNMGEANRPVTRTTVRTRTDNGFTVHTTATNPQGETATRDMTVARDPEAGTRTRTSSFTNFQGQSGSSQSVTTRTDTGSVTATTATRPNGETVERTVTRTCDKAAKSCTKTVDNHGN